MSRMETRHQAQRQMNTMETTYDYEAQPQMKTTETTYKAHFMMRVRKALRGKPWTFHRICMALEDFELQEISPITFAMRAKRILKNHPRLCGELVEYLPADIKTTLLELEMGKQGETQAEETEAKDFVEMVRERCSPSVYEAFLSILMKVKEQELGLDQVYVKVCSLFSGDPEWVEGSLTFTEENFLPRNDDEMDEGTLESQPLAESEDELDLDTAEGREAFGLKVEKGSMPFKQIKERLSRNNYVTFLNIVYWHNTGFMSIKNLVDLVVEFMDQCSKEKEAEYPEQASQSYWLRPRGHELPIASQSSTQNLRVLNNYYICTSKKFEYACKPKNLDDNDKHKNEVEDAKFELDMMKGRLTSTANKVSMFLNGNHAVESPSRDGNSLSAMDLRCIEMLYGDHGLEIRKDLEENELAMMPIILERLRQKENELEELSTECNKIWAKFLGEKCQRQRT